MLACVVLCWCGLAGNARADDETYERERLRKVLVAGHHERDPAPDGKRIAFVRVVQEEVFVERDLELPILLPAFDPTWPNTFHWLTEREVIERELLFHEGDAYDEAKVQESMRNLRGLGTLALVRSAAVRVPDPGAVGVVVYTRDLWSLRLETAFGGAGSAFSGTLTLIERNLVGRNKQLALSASIAPKTFSVGQGYGDGRVFGEKLSLSQGVAVIFNRDTGKSEGSAGSVGFGHPFYDLAQEWAWGIGASYSVSVARSLLGGEVIGFQPSTNGRSPRLCAIGRPAQTRTIDGRVSGAPRTREPPCLAGVWDDRSVGASVSGTYRHGTRTKQEYSLGWGFSDRTVEPNAETALAPADEADFREQILPRARRQVYPSLHYGLYLPRYAVFENLQTYGQSETVRVGPGAEISVAFPVRAFGSSTDAMTFGGELKYTLADSGAYGTASVSTGARLEDGRVSDQRVGGGVAGATPPWFLGRVVAAVGWTARRRDTSNGQVVLGGDNGLRGYASGRFRVIGGSVVAGNVEYRTLPLDILSVQLGGVAFYDIGSVYEALRTAEMHHDVGLGLRILFPQVNRDVFRFDFGVPLDESGFAILFSYGTSQMI